MADLQPYLTTIFNLLLHKLQDSIKISKKVMYCKYFFHNICLFVTVHGAQVLYDQFNTITNGLVGMLVMNIWGENRENWNLSEVEIKQTLVGGSKLLCESTVASTPDVWQSLFASLYTLSTQQPTKKPELTFDDEQAEDRAFDSSYSKLSFAFVPSADPCADVPSGQVFFFSQVSKLSQSRPGQYSGLINAGLSPEAGAEFRAVLQRHGLIIA